MRTMRSASSARRSACSPLCPSSVKHSMTCGPMRKVGFNAEPGSWYTIDAWWERNDRSSASFISVTSSPATLTWPATMRPLDGRYRSAANAVVDLPQPDSPTRPYASPGADVEAHAPQHEAGDAAHDVGHLEVVDLERRGRGAAAALSSRPSLRSAHDSDTAWIESAMRLTAITREAMAMAGNNVGHHWPAGIRL